MPLRSAGRGRGKTPSLEGDTTIRPIAQPTDPFVQVGPTPRSNLWAVAEALSEFESSLTGMVNKAHAEQKAHDAAMAEAEFIRNNEQGYAEAVRSGAVPAYVSPAFAKSYKAAEGRRIARDVTAGIVQNYETWDGKDADDTAGFSPWIAEQVRVGLAGIEDPDVIQHAVPGIRQVTERLGSQHAKDVGDRVMSRAVEGVGKDIIGAIDNAAGEPVPGPDGKLVTYEGLSDTISAVIAEGRKIGIPVERLNKAAAEAVVAKAIQARDYDLLKALPEDIAKTPHAAKLIAEAHDKIGTALYRDETRAERLTNIQRKQATDAATRSLIETLTQDIDAEIPEDVLALGESGDPAFRIKAEDMRDKLRTNASRVTPQQEVDASVRIHTADEPLEQAIREIEAGNIGNPSRVSSILYTAQRLKQSKERGAKSIISTPAAKQYEKALKGRFTEFDVPLGRSVTDEAAYGATLVDYHIALAEWEDENPNASNIERMRAAREIGEEMLKGPAAPAQPASTSPQPPADEGQQQEQRSEAPPQEEPAAAEKPAADPLIEEIRRVNPSLRDVPDEVIRRYLPPGRQSAAEPEAGEDQRIRLAALTRGDITPDMSNRRVRAAVRANNPGAMWYAPWQAKYGVLGRQKLNDGLGQGNNIALFPTKEAGAAAQFDLLNRRYSHMTLAAAVRRWSGGNHWQQYAVRLARTVGVSLDTPMSDVLASREKATLFAKTAAAHEAGLGSYPMSDAQWEDAYDLFLKKNGRASWARASTTNKEG